MAQTASVLADTPCYHCGNDLPATTYTLNNKQFCCLGCKTVFEILNENDLCEYYSLDKKPGISQQHIHKESYAYLDDSSVRKKILEFDPFQILDQNGVGQLVKMATEKGRSVRPDLKVGICGEHGGEPSSVEFCHRVGLNYVSCSPFRVPIARLAAAQAAVRE